MRTLLVFLITLSIHTAYSQQYGDPVSAEGTINASEINPSLVAVEDLKIQGKVEAVCQVKGCWMTMPTRNDQSMRITFKDYGFFVPIDCSGKTAVVQGELKEETISVETLQHLAKDAGKSDQEIEAITEPSTELVFVADGVLLLD